MRPLLNIADLESQLSEPTAGVLDTLHSIPGDIMVLGAGGKMGPTLARMARRARDQLGQRDRKVFAASRFSSPQVAAELRSQGVETITCDLLDRDAVAKLPDVTNVICMAGQKFGTSNAPELTWVMNTLVPGVIAERYAGTRMVVFSTACVYPLVPVDSRGSYEDDALMPPGEYANACVGRERVFSYFAKQNGTPTVLFRLSYAIDLRYGVLLDVASKVARGEPVDVSMGAANVIWQGDANARAIQCLQHTATPPLALNVTGLEPVRIRALAQRFGELLGRPPVIIGDEGPVAWLFDARRSYDLFGPPTVSLDEMIEVTANWVRQGGQTLGKPTHFEVRDGTF